jgi:glucose/mannose-6-phosphate isomerase
VSLLDDDARLTAVDPSGMLAAVEASAESWRDGVARARAVDLTHIPHHDHLAGVVVCGMGGSGIAGDVAAVAAAAGGAMPVTCVKGFRLPAFVGAHHLVVLVSYSGDTEETLACFREAHDRGAQLVAITTGGTLGAMAHQHAFPGIVPAAGLQPRAAFPYLAAGVLVVLERVGVLADLTADLVEIDDVLREQTAQCGGATKALDNPAKTIAGALVGTMPVVIGQDGHLAVAAARWKTQLNENAKVPAMATSLPEFGHNEVVGIGPGAPDASRLAFVALRPSGEDPRLSRRIDAVLAMARDAGAQTIEAAVRGGGAMAQLAAAAQLGDLVSVYLAVLRGVDPTPTDAISRLKAELS